MVDTLEDKEEQVETEKILENYTPEVTKEMLDSVKLKEDGEEKVVDKETIKVSKDNQVVEDVEKVKELYAEFSSFLETKTEMVADEGTKETISTSVDLADAVLGGGFAIGGLNIVVGSPGSGKTMIAAQTLGEGQKKYKGTMLGAFLDSEEATTSKR